MSLPVALCSLFGARPAVALLSGLLLLLGASAFPAAVQAQSADSLFAQARTIAFEEGNYGRARALAYRALEGSPNYHGIRVFAARTLAWEGRRDTARAELHYVLERAPDHYEALKAIIDVESWSDRPTQALEYADRALKHYPDDAYFMRKRASLLRWMERPDAAVAQLNAVLASRPSDPEAHRALQSIKEERMRYTASMTFRRDVFWGTRTPWSFGTATLGRSTSIGSLIGRVRYANRFSTDGLQFEVDAYPSIAKGLYAYLSAGASRASIFPRYRFGGSLYKSLPRGLSAEIGTRYLNFGGRGTFIYTASLTKYSGNYLFRGVTYVTPSTSGTSVSVGGKVRRYFGGSTTYVSVGGSAGSSASAPLFATDVERRPSWSISADGQAPLTRRTLVGASVSYDTEKTTARTLRRFSFSVSATYKF